MTNSFKRWLLPTLLLVFGVGGTEVHAQAKPATAAGILQVAWGDPQRQSSADVPTVFSLALPNGQVLPLVLHGKENAALHYVGMRVHVTGRAVPNPIAVLRSASAISVDTLDVVGDKSYGGGMKAAMVGSRRVVFLLAKYSDDSNVPHPPSFYLDLSNPDSPPAGEPFTATINGFFKKTSWNQFSWMADVGGVGGLGAPGGWMTLPHPKTYYANCGWGSVCADLSAVFNDTIALAQAQGINVGNYDNVNIVLSNDLDCCAWGGSWYSATYNKSFGTTWEPPWGQDTSTYAHEMGHSLGLPHSGWVYYAYDSPWDVMSLRTFANNPICGSYQSDNNLAVSNLYCPEPGNGYIAPHKDYLGWLPPANEVVIANLLAPTTVTLEADALPLGSLPKMVRICIPGEPCSGVSAHFVSIEARVGGLGSTSQYDNGLYGAGIVIHDFQGYRPAISGRCFRYNQSGWAMPIDATAGDYDYGGCGQPAGSIVPNWGLYNAQFLPGQTYTSADARVSISVVSQSGSTYVLSISPSPLVIAPILELLLGN